ncbi:MAG: long-chain-fatty-acid--CoA ligase [Bryobacterales bacterium]|nr:long-chain-fatty-acid--CoA ligase [Bryobacterales bacterium]
MFVPLTPLRCLDRAIKQFGRKVGIVCGSQTFTYAQFGERCQKLASALQRLGVQKGDRAAYMSFNTHKLLEGYYGVVQAGAIVMPLNVRLSEVELVQILNHSEASTLCFEADFVPLVEQFQARCPAIRHYVALDDALAPGAIHYEDLLSQGHPEPADIMRVDENSVAELFYTSGSTGNPKGVMLTHRNLYMHAMACATTVTDPMNTVDLHTIPLFHANGWGRPQTSTMLGFKQVMVRRFDPALVFALIQEHKATDMSLVPTMANMLLNAPNSGSFDLSSLRIIMLGGAAASPELLQRVAEKFKCDVFSGYGLTETTPVLTMGKPKPTLTFANDAERYRRQAMAGWPIPNVEVRVVDLSDHDVPKDGQTIGEVIAQSDNVMEGYYRDPEATRAVIRDGWFHTGDMAVWDEEGYIHIVDRKKEIIISGGENISSIEVEKAIFAHPAVYECAVVAAPDERWGEVPAAIVVRKPDAQLGEEELLAFLETRLGRYKLPRVIHFSEEPLPKTGTGKIRKMILRERFWAGKEKRVQG